MSNTPWKTDKWFTSPWNFLPEVTKDIKFADKIEIHDVTLRDGEQQANLAFNKDYKVAIAEKLAELGVSRIEAGMPAVSAQDKAAIEEIVKRLGDKTKIFGFARCMKEDVKKAADCGVHGVIIEIPSSEHMVKEAYRWDMQKAIDLSIEATSYAKELGLYTVFFPIDMTRADMDWAFSLINTVATKGHMDALAVVDTMGVLNPHAVPYLIKKARAAVPGKPLETHFHDDFGMGTANTIMGLASGCEVAHLTVSSLGERAGNASYEEVALSLLTLYGKDLGLKTEMMYPLSKFVRSINNVQVRGNKDIIGEDLFKIESGIVSAWYANVKDTCPTECCPYLPELVGQHPTSLVLCKGSGLPNIEFYLDQIGMECKEKDQKMEILMAVKNKAIEKLGPLTIDEFKEIAHKVLD